MSHFSSRSRFALSVQVYADARQGERPIEQLVRTYTRTHHYVDFNEPDIAFSECGTPTYAGLPMDDYTAPDHPLQQAIARDVARAVGMDVQDMPHGIDGCSAPNYAMPLSKLAYGYARLASGAADILVRARVVDLRWIAPLPIDDVLREARATGTALVVDETRRSGGVAEGVLAALVDAGFGGRMRRVTSKDSFVPLGDAAKLVLLSEAEIEAAIDELML